MINSYESQKGYNDYKIAAFYSFSPIAEEVIPIFLTDLKIIAEKHNVRGRICYYYTVKWPDRRTSEHAQHILVPAP